MLSRRATAGTGWLERWGAPLLAGVVVAAGSLAVPAAADQGVAWSASEITFTEPLARGSRHEVPTIWVSNPGSDPADFSVQVTAVADAPRQRRLIGHDDRSAANPSVPPTAAPRDPARSVPADWLAISPERFHLAPGGTQAITGVLEVPSDAAPGRYRGLLSAGIGGRGAGATVGAAAAARIDFTVTGSEEVLARPVPPVRGGARELPEAAALLAVAVFIVGALVTGDRVRRRFVIHVERR